jgi:hypothetical protein
MHDGTERGAVAAADRQADTERRVDSVQTLCVRMHDLEIN